MPSNLQYPTAGDRKPEPQGGGSAGTESLSVTRRWAIVATVFVAGAVLGAGYYASRQPHLICPNGLSVESATTYPKTWMCGLNGVAIDNSVPSSNGALLSPGHAVWLYIAAAAVLVAGLLIIWAFPTGKGAQGPGTPADARRLMAGGKTYVSLRIHAGDRPVEVAADAGHSIGVLWTNYAREFERSRHADRLPLAEALRRARRQHPCTGPGTVPAQPSPTPAENPAE